MSKYLKIISGVGASGVSLERGKTYKVPGDVSEKDAKIICQLKKGEMVDKPEKAASKAKKNDGVEESESDDAGIVDAD